MKISLQNVGKRFNREWIFRHFDYEFTSEKSYAITGPNGSGKSTLLQVISGASMLSEGTLTFSDAKSDDIYKLVSITSPYQELVEEMTLSEFFTFHSALKKWLPNITSKLIIKTLQLEESADKQIRNFSSGMKQRVKLAQAIFSNVPVVLLDEPTTNLDEEGTALYTHLIKNYCENRLLIVSSNDFREYAFCKEIIDMRQLKSF